MKKIKWGICYSSPRPASNSYHLQCSTRPITAVAANLDLGITSLSIHPVMIILQRLHFQMKFRLLNMLEQWNQDIWYKKRKRFGVQWTGYRSSKIDLLMRPHKAKIRMDGHMITTSQLFLCSIQIVWFPWHLSTYQDLSMAVTWLNGKIYMPSWRQCSINMWCVVLLFQDLGR